MRQDSAGLSVVNGYGRELQLSVSVGSRHLIIYKQALHRLELHCFSLSTIMSAQDMRDMLGLTGDAIKPPAAKKRKLVEKRPLEKGMAREVSALMGERAPPVSMIPVQPKYKQRPRRTHKAAPWEFVPFFNQARDDALVLQHWQPKKAAVAAPTAAETPEVTEEPAVPEKKKEPEPKQQDYKFAKYNVQVEVPEYDEAVYEAHLKDDNWTKEETDYLVSLVKEYSQKWPVVVDRYEYSPPPHNDDSTQTQEAKQRSMEDLKARYYTVSARALAQKTPIASMDGKQYSLYQTLTNFDPVKETERKELAGTHLKRSQAQVEEEAVLLSELQRIMINQQALENERKEIRDRLDYPIATSNATGTAYSTSQALGQLFQQLLAADRLKKDRRMKDLPAGATSSMQGPGRDHRDSIVSAAQSKRPARESMGSNFGQDNFKISQQMGHRFFVTQPTDRLTNGVGFASDKLSKPRIAKSSIQTERIASVLTHLKIPDLIPLPTQKVIEEFDRLMGKVGTLLDMRKLGEKEDQEIRVRMAEKGIKADKEKGGDGSVKVEEGEGAGDKAADESTDAGVATRGQKRSASVMSAASHGESKRSRQT